MLCKEWDVIERTFKVSRETVARARCAHMCVIRLKCKQALVCLHVPLALRSWEEKKEVCSAWLSDVTAQLFSSIVPPPLLTVSPIFLVQLLSSLCHLSHLFTCNFYSVMPRKRLVPLSREKWPLPIFLLTLPTWLRLRKFTGDQYVFDERYKCICVLEEVTLVRILIAAFSLCSHEVILLYSSIFCLQRTCPAAASSLFIISYSHCIVLRR